jgi:hypothetical protein
MTRKAGPTAAAGAAAVAITTTTGPGQQDAPGRAGDTDHDAYAQQREFLRYARGHVRGVAWRSRCASVLVAVTAILVTGGVTAFTTLNTLAVRDSVNRTIAAERDDLTHAVASDRDALRQLIASNAGQAREDAKALADLRQTVAKLQTTADSLTDTYAAISREQAQILAALGATKKQLDAAQQAAGRALRAADDAQATAAKAALPLDQVARIADAQRTVERTVQLARADLGEIHSALTLVQESKDRGLPRLSAILEEAEVSRARLATLVRDATTLRNAMLPAIDPDDPPQSATATVAPTVVTEPSTWPEHNERSR